MALSVDDLKKAQSAIELALKAAEAAEIKPSIDTSRIVDGIDKAIVGLSAAVSALQAVKFMLKPTAVTSGTVTITEPISPAPVVTPAPASIEAAAEQPKPGKWSKVWGVVKKVLPVAGTVAAVAVPGGPIIKAAVDSLASGTTADATTAALTAAISAAAAKAYADSKAKKE